MKKSELKNLEKMRIEKALRKITLSSTYGMYNDNVNSKVFRNIKEIKDS